MAKFVIKVGIKVLVPIPEPAVQMWVDRNRDGFFSLDESINLDSGQEDATGKAMWSGEEDLSDPADGTLFSAALVAASGSKWHITIEDESGNKTYDSTEQTFLKNTVGVLGQVR